MCMYASMTGKLGVAQARLACCQATQCVLHLHGNSCLPPYPSSEEGTLSDRESGVCACVLEPNVAAS